jgi:TrmH family RNA methyltransferase
LSPIDSDSYMVELSHKRIRDLAALQKASARRLQQRFLIEGLLCVEEALIAGFPLEQVYYTIDFQESEVGTGLIAECKARGVPMEQIPVRILQRISTQEHSQGVVAIGICQKNESDWVKSNEDLLVVISRGSDPGNVGTIIRTAYLFKVLTIWLGEGSVDPWHPKLVRGSMGSMFHMKVRRVTSLIDELMELKRQKVQVWALDSNGRTPFNRLQRKKKTVIILGHETEGIASELLELSDERIILGKPGAGVGSLNVAVAAGIFLYLYRN